MTEREELKPCPFCGGNYIVYNGTRMAFVRCVKCGIEGPIEGSINQAIESWNRRAAAQPHARRRHTALTAFREASK